MANLSWKIGAVSVTRIVESCNPLPPTGLFPEATPEALDAHAEWLRPHFMDANGNFLLSIHALLIEVYRDLGFAIEIVPVLPSEERADYILARL